MKETGGISPVRGLSLKLGNKIEFLFKKLFPSVPNVFTVFLIC